MILTTSVNFVPRTGSEFSFGDFIELDIAQVEWIIDEAQTLTEDTLEQVRLLSNLETSREKLIQILLLGQPELDRKLDERGLALKGMTASTPAE